MRRAPDEVRAPRLHERLARQRVMLRIPPEEQRLHHPLLAQVRRRVDRLHRERIDARVEHRRRHCHRRRDEVLDLARAHILALGAPSSAFYNLGTGGGSSVREVIEACAKITGREIATIEKPRRPGDPPRLIASSEKIKKELGWRPQFQSLEAIIESAWKWHEKFPSGYED